MPVLSLPFSLFLALRYLKPKRTFLSIITLISVVGVMLGFGWAYPAFIAALAILIAYQAYQLSHIFSAALFGLTVLDAVLLALTVHEYVLRRRHAAA